MRVMIAVCVALLVGHAGASAAAACDPGRPNDNQNYIVGTYRSPGATVGGVYSKIRIKSVYLDPDPLDKSSGSYVEIAANLQFWASIGWEKVWNPVIGHHTYVEYQVGSSHTYYGLSHETVGTDIYYTVLWQAGGPNKISFQRSGVTVIGPVGVGSYTPTYAVARGGIHSLATQMPGGSTSRELLYDTNIWYNGAWRAFDGILQTSSTTYFGAIKVNTRDYQIQDNSCSS